MPISAVWWPKYTACAKNVRHGAKNGWHGDENVQHGAQNMRHCAENVACYTDGTLFYLASVPRCHDNPVSISNVASSSPCHVWTVSMSHIATVSYIHDDSRYIPEPTPPCHSVRPTACPRPSDSSTSEQEILQPLLSVGGPSTEEIYRAHCLGSSGARYTSAAIDLRAGVN